MPSDEEIQKWLALATNAAADKRQVLARQRLAQFTAKTFTKVGNDLHLVGHIFGPDRAAGSSPQGHGSDEVVGVALILRIAGQLASASADLFADGRHYAAAALLRQIVEVEYLAWAFATRDKDASRWLRSTVEERRTFFTPAKLREAAKGKFRGKDYGHHCELGGHPVPGSATLFRNDESVTQLLLSDMLGHTGRTWDHILDWSHGNAWAVPIHQHREVMWKRYSSWREIDKLTELPQSP